MFTSKKTFRSLSCNDSFSIIFDEDASKISETSKKHTNTEPPNILSKDLQSWDNSILSKSHTTGFRSESKKDDSFIVFQDSTKERQDLSNKILDKVKEYDGYVKTDTSNHSKKKVSN